MMTATQIFVHFVKGAEKGCAKDRDYMCVTETEEMGSLLLRKVELATTTTTSEL